MWTAKLEMRSIVVVYVNVRQSFLQDIWYVIGHAGFSRNPIEVVVVGLGNRMMRSFLYIQEEGGRACTSVNLVILV